MGAAAVRAAVVKKGDGKRAAAGGVKKSGFAGRLITANQTFSDFPQFDCSFNENVKKRAHVFGVSNEKAGGQPAIVPVQAAGLPSSCLGRALVGRSVEPAAGVPMGAALIAALAAVCRAWGIEAAAVGESGEGPAVARMCCARWWLRRLRRAHSLRAEGAAVAAGVVRRGMWPYASQDAVERRGEQRRRNARALDLATVACEETGESLALAEVVAGSMANPEVKRSELMVRIRGCDAIAQGDGLACEFWTLTAPSRYHAQRTTTGKKTEPNPNYDGSTPKDAQRYLSRVWARARAAWKRRGLQVYGLRTAEPHHDGCPHWHLICYGTARDVRFARRLLRVYALRDAPGEPGAKEHRFVYLPAKAGRYGAAYAAKYISKNINGEGMGKAQDGEAGRKVSESVKRVDAWAASCGVRQFQFFGCPKVSIWRVLRRFRGPVGVVGSMLERARAAADDVDFAEFWRCCVRGGLELVYRSSDCLTAYGDAAAARIAGVREGARRAMLPVKKWVIHWAGKKADSGAAAGGFGVPRSCVNNCTRGGVDRFADAVAAVFGVPEPIDNFHHYAMRQ